MKKIVVEKIPPVAPTNRIVTPLSSNELVAYVTESGTICVLQKLSKDYKDRERFGFCNLAYSSNSGPTFVGYTWFEAIAKAGASRELIAFDTYKELLTWITQGFKAFTPSTSEAPVKLEAVKNEHALREEFYKSADGANLLNEIPRKDVDWNGAGQVNHTHRSMTAIYRKVNELVECVNMSYYRNKARIFAMAYKGYPPTDLELTKQEAEKSLAISKFVIPKKLLHSAISIALVDIEENTPPGGLQGDEYSLYNRLQTLFANIGEESTINTIELI